MDAAQNGQQEGDAGSPTATPMGYPTSWECLLNIAEWEVRSISGGLVCWW